MKITEWLFNNKSTHQTIAKNTVWLAFGQIAGRLFRAGIVIYAARVLGAASWGAFSYAIGIAAFLTIFSDIGINALITKEATRNPELKDQYVATAFFTKLGLLAVFILGTIVIFPYLTNIPEASSLMPIVILVFAFDTLRDLGSAVSRALERMEIEALINVFTNLAITALGFAFLMFAHTSKALALSYAVGSGLGFAAIMITLSDHFRNIFTHFRAALIKPILATAWPFGLMGLMGTIMLNTDILIVGWMRSATEVGYYAAAQKPVLLLYIFPTLLASSIFPVIARLAKTEPEKIKAILERYIALVICAAIPVSLIGVLFAKQIILLLFGAEYLPAVLTLQILMPTILIVFPSAIIGNAIFAYDHHKSFLTFVIVSALCNLGFDFLLIPRWGIEGSAVGTFLTQLVTNFLIWRKLKSINGIRVWPRIKQYLRLG